MMTPQDGSSRLPADAPAAQESAQIGSGR